MGTNSKVFISHSSKDIDFVIPTMEFIKNLGVSEDLVFCSSIEGHGVLQGSRIEDSIREELSSSSVIIYIISKNFIESQACMQELGVGWYNKSEKKSFFVLLDDVQMDEIKGFLGNSYKFTFMKDESLSEFVDDFIETMGLEKKKYSIVSGMIKSLLKNTEKHISSKVEKAKLSEEEQLKKVLNELHKSIEKLNLAEKKVIAYLYFKEDRIGLFDVSTGIINLLDRKKIVSRLSQMSTYGYNFPYTLNPWIIDFIQDNEEFRNELLKLDKKNNQFEEY